MPSDPLILVLNAGSSSLKLAAFLAAALEGLDAIVFTGGIGENSQEVREKVCDRLGWLGWLGVVFDNAAKWAGGCCLNAAGSRVSILRIPADEEAVIAAHDLSVLFITGPGHGGPSLVANAYLEGRVKSP